MLGGKGERLNSGDALRCENGWFGGGCLGSMAGDKAAGRLVCRTKRMRGF